MRTYYSKEEYFKKILSPHKSHITSVSKWNDYAKDKNLPFAYEIISVFGSWNRFKQEIGLPVTKTRYTKEELKQIALEHKDFIRRKHVWDKYSKKHGLPASATFINAFGSWNELKKDIGIVGQEYKDDHFTKEEIVDILRKHGENYQNRTQWDEYAKKHDLPTYKTIRKYLTYDEIMRYIGRKSKEESLIKTALAHEKVFFQASMKKWDDYARENGLPSSYSFYNTFGSWNKAKEIIKDIKNHRT